MNVFKIFLYTGLFIGTVNVNADENMRWKIASDNSIIWTGI